MFDEPVAARGEFVVADGFFLKVCAQAAANPDKDVFVLIDELNRCNVSSVLGDLLLTLEASRRARFAGEDPIRARLEAGKQLFRSPCRIQGGYFSCPKMSTSSRPLIRRIDRSRRSTPQSDEALLLPDRARYGRCRSARAALPSSQDAETVATSGKVFRRFNEDVLAPCLGPDAMLGPSYLYALTGLLEASHSVGRTAVWRYNVIPQLIDVTRSYGAEDLSGLDLGTSGSPDTVPRC